MVQQQRMDTECDWLTTALGAIIIVQRCFDGGEVILRDGRFSCPKEVQPGIRDSDLPNRLKL